MVYLVLWTRLGVVPLLSLLLAFSMQSSVDGHFGS